MPPTLKQRLAALSTVPSAPSSPLDSPRKSFFNPPWNKRHHDIPPDHHDALDILSNVMAKMIFQAGVDYETRPMVVINASALPDPREVNYDLLLSRILSYLNLYVEADYTLVFFAAGGKHTPGWNWVWKAYRSLSRKYRKNLKRLYIVHSNFFTKMLFSLAGAIVSPKFFRKITYIDTLSELAYYVPITQIDIPPAVYQENLKRERKITLPTPTVSSMFGVPLEDIMGYDGEKGGIPRVVKDCIQFLRERGMEEEGLFRRSPPSSLLRAAQDAYDRGHVVSLETFADPHLAAVLLKKYLRDLPAPIFPESLYPVIRRCPPPSSDPSDMSSVMYIRDTLLVELPPCSYILLSHILHLLHEVSLRSASNRMDAHNLSVVLCPNLVKGSNPLRDVMMCSVPGGPAILQSNSSHSNYSNSAALADSKTTLGSVIKVCIQQYYEIFDEVRDRTEALPPSFSNQRPLSESASSGSGQHVDDEESIDDAMLVMPIGPSHPPPLSQRPPSAWTAGATGTFRPRHRSTPSGGSASAKGGRSVYAAENGGGTFSKARSVISIEKTVGRKGSISVGRGTTRKSSGAGVEAIGITAEGFFSPPPVPPLPRPRATTTEGHP